MSLFIKRPPLNVGDVSAFGWKEWFRNLWRTLRNIQGVSVSQTVSFTATEDGFYPIDATSGNITVTLPLAASNQYKTYRFKKVDTVQAYQVTISPSGSDTIDGGTTLFLLSEDHCVTLQSDGISTWHIIGGSAFPRRVAWVALFGNGAAIAATTAYAVPANGAGWYRISTNAFISRAGSVSSTLGTVQHGWTDPSDNVARVTAGGGSSSTANTTATSVTRETILFAKASTNITYQVGYADGGGANNMQFGVRVMVEYLGP